MDGADPGVIQRWSGRGSSGHDMRSRRTPASGLAKTSDSATSGASEGGPEGLRRETVPARHSADGHTLTRESDCAGGGGEWQEAACARPGGYLFVSDIRPMEVWRALVVGCVVRKRRARLRWSLNAEEHERGERLDKNVHDPHRCAGIRNVPERATQIASAAQAARAEDKSPRKDEVQLWFGIRLSHELLYTRPV